MEARKFRKIKDERKEISLERIEILEGMIEKKPEFADRYRALIKRLKEKYRLHKDF
jgi:hypothetical protein